MSQADSDDRERLGTGILHPEGMRAARNLATGIVHEVNNVLGVIIGNAHLAKKNISSAEAVERYIVEVRNAAEEGREIMRQLSMIATNGARRARVVSLNDLAHQAVSGLTKPVAAELSVVDPAVRVDLWLAQDALSSVARFLSATLPPTSVRIATRILGQAAMLTIEDDGPSPTDDELTTLFAPFIKLSRRPKTGLELTKLAHLAERHGGHVAATACEPNGLRIVLTLPLVNGER
jgi:signal transduction histidine kinase